MYALLTERARRSVTRRAFTGSYRRAAATATAVRVNVGRAPDPKDGVVALPVRVRTRIFGTVAAQVRLPFEEHDDRVGVAWAPHLVFPGLAPGMKLRRRTEMPPRADLLARDGTPLASRNGEASPLGESAGALVGVLGPAPRSRRAELRAVGYPSDAQVGISGLEAALERGLAGRPGGELLAGDRRLASSRPQASPPVRSTIDPDLQRAASEALEGRVGGIAVMRPGDGEVLALSGEAATSLQPPGSTFKLVTLTAVLETRAASPDTKFPVKTSATLDGSELQNANEESCGGTLVQSFAHSCNSVFAPLGAKVGAARLVATAERYGFNRPPGLPGAATSRIPPADEIDGALAEGSTAIGQDKVEATALQMTSIAATIGAGGRRALPTVLLGARPRVSRIIAPRIAQTIRRMMVAAVKYGTGTSAAISGVQVAGKTGTAELGVTQGEGVEGEDTPEDTDAWFASFAPARRPKVAVGVLLVRSGVGGETAAPAAKTVLETALKD